MIRSGLVPWTPEELAQFSYLMVWAVALLVVTIATAIEYEWDWEPQPEVVIVDNEPVLILPPRMRRERDRFAATITTSKYGDRRRRFSALETVGR